MSYIVQKSTETKPKDVTINGPDLEMIEIRNLG